MTKEEIADKYLGDQLGVNEMFSVYESMDEYARQQAVSFLKYFTGSRNSREKVELDYADFVRSQDAAQMI